MLNTSIVCQSLKPQLSEDSLMGFPFDTIFTNTELPPLHLLPNITLPNFSIPPRVEHTGLPGDMIGPSDLHSFLQGVDDPFATFPNIDLLGGNCEAFCPPVKKEDLYIKSELTFKNHHELTLDLFGMTSLHSEVLTPKLEYPADRKKYIIPYSQEENMVETVSTPTYAQHTSPSSIMEIELEQSPRDLKFESITPEDFQRGYRKIPMMNEPGKKPKVKHRWHLLCSHCRCIFLARPTPKNSRYVVNHICKADGKKRRQFVIGIKTRRCERKHLGPCIERIIKLEDFDD